MSPSPRALKWLHRIGYVCTVVVALQVTAIAGLFVYVGVARYLDDVARREETRTKDGPLKAAGPYDSSTLAIPLLALLPPREIFDKEGLRIAIIPQLGLSHTGLSLRDTGQDIEAVAVIVRRDDYSAPEIRRFTIPRDAYQRAMKAFDEKTDGFEGATDWWLDGISVGFERMRQKRVTSGSGNNRHYWAVRDIVLSLVKPHVMLP